MTDRYHRSVTAISLVVFLAATGGSVALAMGGDRPRWVALVLFGALGVFAENLDVPLPVGDNVGAGFMLQIAAIIVFRDAGSLLGPLVVGMCCGVYVPHLRERAWRKVAFNIGNFGLSALASATALTFVPLWWFDHAATLLLAALIAAVTFFIVNDLLVALMLALDSEHAFGEILRQFRASDLHSLPFAIFGVFAGRLYLGIGPIIIPLLIVPILIARETFASYLALKQSYDDTVRILIGALEAKDTYTAGHSERVATFARYIGLELSLSPKRLDRLRLAALMHDVGKLVVPNHLLNKPGKLTAEEFARVRLHETVAVEILTRIDFLAPVAPSALSEFTRFRPVADRTGQPIEPHIVAVADAFDAMTSTRSYRRALSQETAFMELRTNAGKQFHPRVVDALIIAIEQRGEHYGSGYETDAHEFEVEPPRAGLGSAGLGDLMEDPPRSKANQ